MTPTEATLLVATLEAAYPRQELREETAKTYILFLQDLDFQIASRVVQDHIRNEKWFPSIAEIREACVEFVHVIPTAETAMEIIRAAVQGNNYAAITNNDLIRRAVATVGFDKVGQSEYSEPLYRQIKDAYENLRKREIKSLQNTPAVGQLPNASFQPLRLEE